MGEKKITEILGNLSSVLLMVRSVLTGFKRKKYIRNGLSKKIANLL